MSKRALSPLQLSSSSHPIPP